MTDAGSPDNLIVNSGWILKQGTDQYILKNNVTLNLTRPRFRDAIQIGPINTFGAGDHSVVCEFEADISLAANWANLNARDQVTGFLPNLPYSLTLQSKPFAPSVTVPTVTVTLTDNKITSTNISNAGANLTSVLLTLSGGTSSPTQGKLVGIISEGILEKIVIVDQGNYPGTAPTVTATQITEPFAFSFNAEVGDLEFTQSDNEGRLRITATLVVTDDTVVPIDA